MGGIRHIAVPAGARAATGRATEGLGERIAGVDDEPALSAPAPARAELVEPAPAEVAPTEVALAELPPLTPPLQYQMQFSTVEEHVRLVERAKALLARERPGAGLGELHLQAMLPRVGGHRRGGSPR